MSRRNIFAESSPFCSAAEQICFICKIRLDCSTFERGLPSLSLQRQVSFKKKIDSAVIFIFFYGLISITRISVRVLAPTWHAIPSCTWSDSTTDNIWYNNQPAEATGNISRTPLVIPFYQLAILYLPLFESKFFTHICCSCERLTVILKTYEVCQTILHPHACVYLALQVMEPSFWEFFNLFHTNCEPLDFILMPSLIVPCQGVNWEFPIAMQYIPPVLKLLKLASDVCIPDFSTPVSVQSLLRNWSHIKGWT